MSYWQKCPACDGMGRVGTRQAATEGYRLCPACKGEGVLFVEEAPRHETPWAPQPCWPYYPPPS